MDKFKVMLICTDLGGTLLNSKGEVSKENLRLYKTLNLRYSLSHYEHEIDTMIGELR